jgi:SAM-dependent methyltransferase
MSDDLDELRALLGDSTRLIRAIGSGRQRGTRPPWRRVELRPVRLQKGSRLQVTSYDERSAYTRNIDWGDGGELNALVALPFARWHVETTELTLQLRVTKAGARLAHRSVANRPLPAEDHDRAKARLLDPAEPFLARLGISTEDGVVRPTRQAKYRQVEEFLRCLAPVTSALRAGDRPIRVVDLGCGNAYLTFAAYRYLTETIGVTVECVGVDARPTAARRNAAVVSELGWPGPQFVEGDIAAAHIDPPDLVMALHACDTATDDALARAVQWGSSVILASPCCHHDLQRQMALSGTPKPYGPLVRHGILRQHVADALTDALRAAILRMVGYRVEVIEFIGSRHTPRNTLIRAVLTGAPTDHELVSDYRQLTEQWSVRPRLADLLAPELSRILSVGEVLSSR